MLSCIKYARVLGAHTNVFRLDVVQITCVYYCIMIGGGFVSSPCSAPCAWLSYRKFKNKNEFAIDESTVHRLAAHYVSNGLDYVGYSNNCKLSYVSKSIRLWSKVLPSQSYQRFSFCHNNNSARPKKYNETYVPHVPAQRSACKA